MTQFFNLESYTECCQYTALFNEDIAKFIPTSEKNTLPLAYKKFLSDYGDRPFLEPPALLSQFPQSFQPRPATLKPKMIGLSIEDGENDHVFIVREVNSLDIGSLNAQYIYANVYRYWNYAPQLEHLASSHKPMVIYDLDSFTPLKIIPLTFIDHSNSLHRIPIVDTRIVEEYKDFKLYSIEQNSEFVKYESCLDNIYQAITHEITANLSMNSRYFTEVYDYLKKINLFRLTSLSQEQILPICLKTNENFFRYDLDLESLVACIIDHLPLKSLSEIIDENKENYNFVLISQFNNLQGFRENIKKQFQNCLTIPNITTEYFGHAWQESQILKFPLYGQNLDKISFFIMEKNEKKAISLPGKICYQGEPEIFVNAEYNHQEFFPIPLKSDHVSLPFEINNAIYTRNEIEQQYKIYNPDYDPAIDTQDHLKVRICFRLQPGKPPKLEVRDETGRMLKSELVDREEVPEEKSINQGYIPTSKIIENCNNISRKNLKELIESDFIADLKKFSFKISEYDYELNFLQVIDEINNFKTKLYNEYRPESSKEYWTQILKMNGFSVELQEIIDIYQSLDHNINNIISDISRSVNNIKEIICNIENRLSKPIKRQEATLKKKELTIKKEVLSKLEKVQQNLLLIFGKSYFLTSKMSLSFICDVSTQKEWRERIRNIARIAYFVEKQEWFLNLFYYDVSGKNITYYKSQEYMWGYARSLMWYPNLYNLYQKINFEQHFSDIVNYSSQLNPGNRKDRTYLQDALIALIYLLTIREYDKSFIQPNSSIYNSVKILLLQLSSHPIYSKQSNVGDVCLNDFLDKLLDEEATSEQINTMIQVA